MLLLISDANILMDVEVGDLVAPVWRQLQPPPTTTKIAALCCYRG